MYCLFKQIQRDELVFYDENVSMCEIIGEIKGVRNDMQEEDQDIFWRFELLVWCVSGKIDFKKFKLKNV